MNLIEAKARDEILFDFDKTLTSKEEAALIKLMSEKPMLRGKMARFVEKGLDIETTPAEISPEGK